MTENIRVLLVDDQALVRSGFALVLSIEEHITVVGEAPDATRALEILEKTPVDVVLMDIQMPGMSGIEATRLIARRGDARVIILTTFDREDYLFGALEAGASGCLLKTASPEDLVSAIESVAGGYALLSPEVTLPLIRRIGAGNYRAESVGPAGSGLASQATAQSEMSEDPQPPALDENDRLVLNELSEREREVLALIAQGMTNTEIADVLYLSQATVKTHISRIFAKTRSRDRVQAVIFAYRVGLVSPPQG